MGETVWAYRKSSYTWPQLLIRTIRKSQIEYLAGQTGLLQFRDIFAGLNCSIKYSIEENYLMPLPKTGASSAITELSSAFAVHNDCGKGSIVDCGNAYSGNTGNCGNDAVGAAFVIADIAVADKESEGIAFCDRHHP